MRTTLLVALLLAGPAVAQTDPVEALAATLSLTDEQANLVADTFDADDPASTWPLVVALLPTLSDAQREALLARPERPGRGGRGAGRRGDGPRGGPRQPDADRLDAQRAARDAALRLNADQSSRLDAVEAEMLGGRRGAGSETVPDAVAAILTPPQAELYRAHRALQVHLRRARGSSRRAR